jgi:competence protein CoiA
MKFAVVNEQRHEAQPDLSGKCPTCGEPMVARCGEKNIWHWAHRSSRRCDPWWENETEWHRAWKGRFPAHWQEIVHRAVDGEKHIADVKTDHGWVLEFQNSYIKPEERRARETFYPKMLWVVNGARRKKDRQQFLEAWERGVPVGNNSLVRRAFSDDCVLLREWAGGLAPAFVDFVEEPVLWWLVRTGLDGSTYVARFPHAAFIEIHRGGQFDGLVNEIGKLAADYESHLRVHRAQPRPGFQQYVARNRRQRRF